MDYPTLTRTADVVPAASAVASVAWVRSQAAFHDGARKSPYISSPPLTAQICPVMYCHADPVTGWLLRAVQLEDGLPGQRFGQAEQP
jgi:hypothetical protein